MTPVDILATHAPAHVVRWGVAGTAFEIHSSSDAVQRRAATVLRPWAVDGAHVSARWDVEAAQATLRPWTVTHRESGTRTHVDTLESAVTSVEYAAVQHLFGAPEGPLSAHAASAVRNGRAVLIFGPSGSGKSTLACGLWLRGFGLLSDDTVVFDPDTRRASSMPRRIGLRDGSRALLGDALWERALSTPSAERTHEGCLFHPDDVDGVARGAATVAACVFLARRGAPSPARVAAAPIVPAVAALAMLPYFNQSRREGHEALIGQLGAFAACVPSVDLARGSLDAMAAVIDELLDGRVP